MSAAELAQKLETTEKELENLRKLSLKAIADYDELKTKYDENIIAYNALRKSCEQQELQLSTIPQVLESVAAEYDEIKTKYEMESGLRDKAESYASQVHKHNQQLKRQSQALKRQSQALFQKLNVVAVDIDFSDIGDILEEEDVRESSSIPNEVEQLKDIIRGLEEKIATLHAEVQRAASDKEVAETVATEAKKMYEAEKLVNEKSKYSLEQYDKTLKQLESASVLLVQDYDKLYQEMEQQKALQVKAEEYAVEMVKDREAMKRQSSALISSAASNDRLMKAMLEIEDLAKQLEAQKHSHQVELDELNSQLNNSAELEKISSLEKQLELSLQQVTEFEKRINDAETNIQELEKQNRKLQHLLDNPPPPPPPPPPPIKSLLPKLSEALNLKKKKQTKKRVLQNAQGAQNAVMASAIEEMMARIKKGNALKKRVSTGNKPAEIAKAESSAIGEMHGLLTSLKTKQRLGHCTSLPASSEPKADSQLLKLLNARRELTDAHADDKQVSAVSTINSPAGDMTPSKPLPSPRKSVRKLASRIVEEEEEVTYEEITN